MDYLPMFLTGAALIAGSLPFVFLPEIRRWFRRHRRRVQTDLHFRA